MQDKNLAQKSRLQKLAKQAYKILLEKNMLTKSCKITIANHT